MLQVSLPAQMTGILLLRALLQGLQSGLLLWQTSLQE
jgi:hypothetical protein